MDHCNFEFMTNGRGLYDITSAVGQKAASLSKGRGLVNVFLRHTSASLIITENSDPNVLKDIEDFLLAKVPDGTHYRHHQEGADDMPAHIRSVLTSCSMNIPFEDGKLLLGQWQALYLYEHRYQAHIRHLIISVYGA